MVEAATAERLPLFITIQGRAYAWTPEQGLDPAVAATAENWIWKKAIRLQRVAEFKGCSVEDLVQEGRLGALIAALRFDPAKNAGYLTYAVFWIRERMLRALRNGDIYIPDSGQGRQLHTGCHPQVISLDRPIFLDGDPTTLADLLCVEEAPEESPDLFHTQARDLSRLRLALSRLKPRDRELIERRFGLNRTNETLEAIAADWGFTRQGIHQLQARALVRLRKQFNKIRSRYAHPAK